MYPSYLATPFELSLYRLGLLAVYLVFGGHYVKALYSSSLVLGDP